MGDWVEFRLLATVAIWGVSQGNLSRRQACDLEMYKGQRFTSREPSPDLVARSLPGGYAGCCRLCLL